MTDQHLRGGHPDHDLLLDLAVSDVDEGTREVLTRHLARCEPCRAEYAGLADAVDHVLAAAPRVAPPPGFSRSVLAAMGMDGRRETRSRRRRGLVTALVAAAAFLLGASAAAVVGLVREQPAEIAASGPALLSGDGERVGTILRSTHYDEPVYVVTLTAGRPGMRYECVFVAADGSRLSGGSWEVQAGAGDTWIVAAPAEAVVAMELVTEDGRTWARTTL